MKLKTLLVATLAAMSLSAMANTTASDPFYINDFEVTQGDRVWVTINFKNATPYSATQGDVTFGHDGLTPVAYKHVGTTALWFKKASRLNNEDYDHTLAGNNPVSTHMVRWVEYSATNMLFDTGDGPFIKFALKVAKNVPAGKYECTITETYYSTGVADEKGANDGKGPDTKFTVTVKASDGINDVNADKAVAGVQYFNLAGQASATPFEGVNVMVKTYTDGSKSVNKVIK